VAAVPKRRAAKATTKGAAAKGGSAKNGNENGSAKGERSKPPRARPMWSGTVAFGLVALPVQLFPANRTARTSLRMVTETGQPLERRYFADEGATDARAALEPDAIVRGFPIGGDQFVVVEDEELEALEPDKSQEIDLSRFVDEAEVDPMLFERGYFLAPDRGALKAYRLLAKTMEDAGRVGIATFVMRDTEYLVAIIADDGILRAQTLRFHDELRSPEDVGLPELGDADAKLRKEAERAIGSLAADTLDRQQLRDRASKRLLDLVAEKRDVGEDVVELEADSGEAPVDEVDLMQVLKASLAQADEEEEAASGSAPEKAARAPEKAARAPQKGAAKGATDLGARTKEELYERAQELAIEGRSGMNKQQLVAAIRKAS
jgi:DNA end-binding protein Ku